MKQFIYKAKDMTGKVLTGAVEAPDRRSAMATISSKDCYVLRMAEVHAGRDLFRNPVTTDTLLAFTRKVRVMLQSGIDMLTVLKIAWSQTEDRAMQLVISELRALLSKGIPFASALKRFPFVFPEIYISLIAVGERGGVLTFALDKIMDQLIRQKETAQKIKKALMYPVIVLVFALLVVIGMLVFFIPMFEQIFKKMRIEMPFITQCLVNTSHFFIKSWWILLMICFMIFIGIKKMQQTRQGRYWLDKNILKIPVVGELIFNIALSRFLHTFSVLLESGVSLIDTINDATRSTGNAFLRDKLSDVQVYLNKGSRLHDALEKSKLFPDFALSLIAIGEETGTLAKNLKVVADMVDENVDNQITKVTTLIGPISIMIVGTFVGVVMIAIYSPLFSLWSGLER